jgi:MYND finger
MELNCICGNSGISCCSRCHNKYYCGVECQKKDWSIHKQTCVVSVTNTKPKVTKSAIMQQIKQSRIDNTLIVKNIHSAIAGNIAIAYAHGHEIYVSFDENIENFNEYETKRKQINGVHVVNVHNEGIAGICSDVADISIEYKFANYSYKINITIDNLILIRKKYESPFANSNIWSFLL